MTFAWSTNEEDWHGGYDTREAALADVSEVHDVAWTAEEVPGTWNGYTSGHAEDVLERVANRAYDEVGEYAEDFPDFSEEDVGALDIAIEQAIDAWIVARKIAAPTFFTVCEEHRHERNPDLENMWEEADLDYSAPTVIECKDGTKVQMGDWGERNYGDLSKPENREALRQEQLPEVADAVLGIADAVRPRNFTAVFDKASGECMQVLDHRYDCMGGPDTCGGCASCLIGQTDRKVFDLKELTEAEAKELKPRYG